MGIRQSGKAKSSYDNRRAWELETSPIWHLRGNEITPSPLCLKWWQSLAEKQYGNRQMWLEIAHELGYVVKAIDHKSGNITYEPYGFEYDRCLMRKSLDLPQNSPLVFREVLVNSQPYHELWDRLLRKETNENSSDLG